MRVGRERTQDKGRAGTSTRFTVHGSRFTDLYFISGVQIKLFPHINLLSPWPRGQRVGTRDPESGTPGLEADYSPLAARPELLSLTAQA